jgi:hypothetical protein
VNLRRLAPWILGAFALWYLLTSPTEAAHAVTGAASGLATAGESLATFVNALGDE